MKGHKPVTVMFSFCEIFCSCSLNEPKSINNGISRAIKSALVWQRHICTVLRNWNHQEKGKVSIGMHLRRSKADLAISQTQNAIKDLWLYPPFFHFVRQTILNYKLLFFHLREKMVTEWMTRFHLRHVCLRRTQHWEKEKEIKWERTRRSPSEIMQLNKITKSARTTTRPG